MAKEIKRYKRGDRVYFNGPFEGAVTDEYIAPVFKNGVIVEEGMYNVRGDRGSCCVSASALKPRQ